MKLKGGILYYSLLVIIFSSSLVGLELLISFYNSRHLIDSVKIDEMTRNSSSAINMYLGGMEVFPKPDSIKNHLIADTVTIDFLGSDINVLLTKKKWGNYYIIRADSKWKHWASSSIALAGSDLQEQEKIALFVPDKGSILSFSGNTIIRGTCYLPDKTARMSSVEGQQFIYKDLVKGEIKESTPMLPDINSSVLSFAKQYLESTEWPEDSVIYITALDSFNVVNSFNEKTLFVFNDTISNLSNFSFKGNIILWCTRPVILDETSRLKDVIVFAPKITILSGFKGEFQAYALQNIRVGDNCHIGYPSQLCVIQAEKAKYNPADSLIVSLGTASKLDGGIIIQSFGLPGYLSIGNEAEVTGQVYNKGTTQIRGSIIGSLYCNEFFLSTPRARYYNHLLNITIDNLGLSEYFAGVDLFKEIYPKSVIKWLN